jgi:hypothetical protein
MPTNWRGLYQEFNNQWQFQAGEAQGESPDGLDRIGVVEGVSGFRGAPTKPKPIEETLRTMDDFNMFMPDQKFDTALNSLSKYAQRDKADCYSSDPPEDLGAYYTWLEGKHEANVRVGLDRGLYTGVEKDFAIAYITSCEVNVKVTQPCLSCTTFTELVGLAEELVYASDPTSTPGFPYKQRNQNNGQLFEDHVLYDGYTEVQRAAGYAAFTVLAICAESGRADHTAIELLNKKINGMCTLIVKKEPNPIRKLEAPRIVVAMALHVNVATQLLTVVENPPLGQSSYLYGWGNTTEKIAALSERLRVRELVVGGKTAGNDVTGWETSVTRRSILWWHFVCAISSPKPYLIWPVYATQANALASVAYISPFGIVYAKALPGLQPSGNKFTTFGNSTMRTSFAVSHGNSPSCNGDDCLEATRKDLDTLVAAYAMQGLKVREVVRVAPTKFAFSSHNITYKGGVATWQHSNPAKSIFRMYCEGKKPAEMCYLLKENFSDVDQTPEFYALLNATVAVLERDGFVYDTVTAEFFSQLWNTDSSCVDEFV